MQGNDISLISILAFSTLLPFLIACGTCYIKISIVFIMVRNALGLQQTPSNMTLNGIALILSFFVMLPIVKKGYEEYQQQDNNKNIEFLLNDGLDGYKRYLLKYSEPELVNFFEKAQRQNENENNDGNDAENDDENNLQNISLFSLLPAYALSEIKSAFKIGFYLYLPFVIIDLLISSILLALGMMMMSPVTISVPIKLVLFVTLDGWTLLSKSLILQYIELIP